MKLVVDVGNSRIKWARVRDGCPERGTGFQRREPLGRVLDAAWGDLERPAGVLISSVAGGDFETGMERWMADRWGCRPDWFRSSDRTLGLVNGYRDPSRLGSDRWAAVIGARGLYPGPVGVIDAGTAITLDVVDGGDRHLGGLILPGPELAERSLVSHTATIRETSGEFPDLLGRSTGGCVANGVRFGLAGAVARWTSEVEKAVDGVTWVATGGAWSRLSLIIDRPFHHEPDLVLRGLARVLE